MKVRNLSIGISLFLFLYSQAIQSQVPKVYSNILEDNGRIYLNINGKKVLMDPPVGAYTMANFSTIKGTPEGSQFNFQAPLLNGVMYYGFIPQTDSKFPQPVFVGRSARIEARVATALVSAMGDNLDMIGWMSSHQGVLGYRVVDQNARMLYDGAEEYSFHTAPQPGSRTKFTFTYASDSRSGNGGGERNLGGTNAFMMKRIMALNHQYGARFMQFTDDLITGYSFSPEVIRLEYINWKNAVSPYARYIPVVATMGNDEALMMKFTDDQTKTSYQVDNFPFDQFSSEAIFQQEFVNPLNGPESEDGSKYDPDDATIDFPSYKESVFYYIYDNVAMVVLNSNYWYIPNHEQVKVTGGNIHGYIMDNQMAWMKTTLEQLDNDETIDHVFVTVHTPFFPNGGHIKDDMWYSGNNSPRPVIAGKAVDKGIIERRDELLDIIINQTKKTKAILTGDEHNYARTRLNSKTKLNRTISGEKLSLNREIWQINNGAAGAPYYAQEKTPWSKSVEGFTTQNALVFFHVDGDKIQVEVFNPVTLEKFDTFDLN